VQRRSFIAGGISGAALIACRPWLRTEPRPDGPTEHELATLAAIAETFLPGGDSGDRAEPGALGQPNAPDQRSEGSAECDVRGDRMKCDLHGPPGARDTGAVAAIIDPFYGVRPCVEVLGHARKRHELLAERRPVVIHVRR
jgi:hypothetical protein